MSSLDTPASHQPLQTEDHLRSIIASQQSQLASLQRQLETQQRTLESQQQTLNSQQETLKEQQHLIKSLHSTKPCEPIQGWYKPTPPPKP